MTAIIDPTRSFRKLARNNRLANLRLHAACDKLQPGELEAPRTGFFPSIRATLNHILTVDWFYVDALEGGSLGLKAFETDEPFFELPALTQAQQAVDIRLLTLCERLRAEELSEPVHVSRGDRIQVDRRDDLLNHLFQHQTHHRGQIHAMLSGTSVAPPQLDEFIVADDAAARAEEMWSLGWNEQRVMS